VAGYSGTPLPQKLGAKPGSALALLGAPEGFAKTLGKLPQGVEATPRGLVDDKVCAIDAWSGLRLVFRVENRRR
jgi:hypothetical protein